MLFQCRTSVEDYGSTLKQHWVNATCLRKVYRRPSDGIRVGPASQTLKQTMGCDAGPTLRIWLACVHPLYEVHRRQVLNECWPASAMVVEGIHVEDIFNWSPWFFP